MTLLRIYEFISPQSRFLCHSLDDFIFLKKKVLSSPNTYKIAKLMFSLILPIILLFSLLFYFQPCSLQLKEIKKRKEKKQKKKNKSNDLTLQHK